MGNRLPDTTPPRIGPYRVEAPLGEGAMSTVYRAVDPDGDVVAVKLLRGELLASAERTVALARFRREAEIGRRLSHPHIVRVRDAGEWLGCPYLVMDLARGRDLKRVMEGSHPAPEQAVGLVAAVLEALAYAHGQGIVHRDIKPANIMVDEAFHPRLMDFGIAQVPRSDITNPGDLLGTPAYIAPELLRGLPADPRSDLFSTGVVLYALLTRQRPFTGSVATVMQQILFDAPPPPSAVAPWIPVALDTVVMAALEKDPARRHASAAAFQAALDRAALALPDDATLFDGTLLDGTRAATPATRAGDDLAAVVAALGGELRALSSAPLNEKGLAALEAGLDAWFAGAAQATPSPALRQAVRTAVVEDGLVPLAALVAAAIPAPGAPADAARPDWMLLVRLLARLKAAAADLGMGEAAAAEIDGLAFELQSASMLFADRLNRLLETADEPDLPRLSADFLRLEVVLHALEVLGARREMRAVAGSLTMFANQVMRRVNAILANALAPAAGDEMAAGAARFGMALVLARVDELLFLADRLLEGADASLRLRTMAQEVVAEFVGHARAIALRTVEELCAEAGAQPGAQPGALPGAQADAFAGRLKTLGALYAFATRLEGDSARQALAALTEELHGAVRRLLDVVAAAPVEDHGATLRVAAIYEMAETLGWAEIRKAVVPVLRARLLG